MNDGIPPVPAADNPTAERLRRHLKSNAIYAQSIFRNLMILLHTRGIVSVDRLYAQAREVLHRDAAEIAPDDEDPNRPIAPRWDEGERDAVMHLTVRYTAAHLTPDEVDEVVTRSRRAERARTMEEIANIHDVSFELLSRKIAEYCADGKKPTPEENERNMGVRVALIRRLLSDQLEFIGIAKRHLSIPDILPIVRNTIGTHGGIGKVGGKASGMFLTHRIAADHFAAKGESPAIPLGTPESYYVRSDHYQEFIKRNNLMGYYDIKYRGMREIRESFPLIRAVFKNSEFSPYIIAKLREMLEGIGEHPLIVRSSSLLEDNFHSAFSGKYQSIFLGNQGSLEDRLNQLLGAIAEVYASTLHPDPILYRRRRNLIDYDEQMAVLIQKVIGFRYKHYFLPAWAGVAFSRNEWRWTPRIRREDGMMRLALGLGSRVVDRVGDDYPRMVALGEPLLRPEVTADAIRNYSQRFVDVVDLEKNRFERVLIRDLDLDDSFPDLHRIVSIYDQGMLKKPMTRRVVAPASSLVVTFDKLLSGPFPALMREILGAVEKAYGVPMDVEFASDGEKLYILQGRPQGQLIQAGRIRIPENVPPERTVFTASQSVPTGRVRNVEYVVYIDPIDYARLPSHERKTGAGRVVGLLNERLENSRFILMGPGRWGSNNIDLGVRVRYADIHGTRALIEVARARDGYTPEVSFGTHFFQDLIETNIFYLPLYPDEKDNIFNEDFLRRSPNALARVLPEAADYEETIRLIHVPEAGGGLLLHMDMDGESERAIAWLGEEASEEE
ncbi:MAG: hypothetical protein JW958_05320 [Candidatus Eisenbacteria bacterium]|nr:hypothetical protein [Candidatus Eisenbacteria bacterium]